MFYEIRQTRIGTLSVKPSQAKLTHSVGFGNATQITIMDLLSGLLKTPISFHSAGQAAVLKKAFIGPTVGLTATPTIG